VIARQWEVVATTLPSRGAVLTRRPSQVLTLPSTVTGLVASKRVFGPVIRCPAAHASLRGALGSARGDVASVDVAALARWAPLAAHFSHSSVEDLAARPDTADGSFAWLPASVGRQIRAAFEHRSRAGLSEARAGLLRAAAAAFLEECM